MGQRIALWGAGTLDNLGDRLIAEVTETGLSRRLPGARIDHFCAWHADGPTIDRDGRWDRAGDYDAVVVAGGGVFGGPPFRHPLMQLFCFGPRPAAFAPGVFLAWNGVGLQDGTPPPDKPEWRAYLGELRRRLDYCSVRDNEAARRLGLAGEFPPPPVVPDPVFSLPPLDNSRRSRSSGDVFRLGVSLGSPVPRPEFVSVITGPALEQRCPFDPQTCWTAKQVTAVEYSGAEMKRKQAFLPLVKGALKSVLRNSGDNVEVEFFGFGNMYGDRGLAGQQAAGIPGARVVSPDGYNLEQMQQLISGYDGLILSRFHAAILALRAEVPFIAADPHWAPRTGSSKLRHLMEETGLSAAYWTNGPGETGGKTGLEASISRLLGGQIETRGVYEKRHHRVEEHFDSLCRALEKAPPKTSEF